ncbi:MAG: hypothetical protein ACRBK7_20080 [Acidimicrobiales bacterium]
MAGCTRDAEVTATDSAPPVDAGGATIPEAVNLPASGFERRPDPGIYHLGAIGLPSVTFEIGEGWQISNVAGAGEYSPFGDESVRVTARTGGPGRRDMHITRPTHLLDPTFIGPPRPTVVAEGDLWDVSEIRRWLEDAQADGEWGVIDFEETDVSGHSAVSFSLQPDFAGCAGREALAEGIRSDWTGCNGGIAWDYDTAGAEGGRLAVESWDGGQSEHLWIDDVEGKPLVISLQLGPIIDAEWATSARSAMASFTIG